MKNFYWLSNGIFPCNIGFAKTEKAFNKVVVTLTDEVEEYPYGEGGARLNIIRKPKDGLFTTFIISLPYNEDDKAEIAGLIAHEATHLAQFLWEEIGETEPGKEAEAYLVQSITRQILKYLWG